MGHVQINVSRLWLTEWMTAILLWAQVPLKAGPRRTIHTHLFLTVSTGTPGVAFPGRHLHYVGQTGCRDPLCGLQAALNLQMKHTSTGDTEHLVMATGIYCERRVWNSRPQLTDSKKKTASGLTGSLLTHWYKINNNWYKKALSTSSWAHTRTEQIPNTYFLTDVSC